MEKNKQDIFEKIANSTDNKEKNRILENFWLNERREPEENIEIIRKGIEILDKGSDKEKIIALQVISRTRGFPLSDQFDELFGEGTFKKKQDAKTVSYEELLKIIEKCLEFLTADNGNLRIAAANAIHYLKADINKADFDKIYDRILKFREEVSDNKRRSIEYCINKITPLDLGFDFEDLKIKVLSEKERKEFFNNFDPEVKRIWEKNNNTATKLADAYYDSLLNEAEEFIKKDSKENVGYNMFLGGIRVGLDIIIPLLDEKTKKKVDDKIDMMLTKRKFADKFKDELWNEGAYVETISTNDPDYEERMKYFEEKPNDPKVFNCKECNKSIGKHNLYWHEGMCNDCFFDKYDM